MKANDIVKSIMKTRDMTQGDLTKMLGVSSQSGVSAKLNRDMRVSTLMEFIRVLNCNLTITDTKTGEVYEITE